MKYIGIILVVLCIIAQAEYSAAKKTTSSCDCDKMLYLYSPLGTNNKFNLYTFNLTTGQQADIQAVTDANYDKLWFVGEKSDTAIFSSTSYNGYTGDSVIVQVNMTDAMGTTVSSVIGHAPLPDTTKFTLCQFKYHHRENYGYQVVQNAVTNEFGIQFANYNTSVVTYTKIGYAMACPVSQVSDDYTEMALVVNETNVFLVGLSDYTPVLLSTKTLKGYADFVDNVAVTPLSTGVNFYKTMMYGVSYVQKTPNSAVLSIYEVDVHKDKFKVLFNFTEDFIINDGFPGVMFSSDQSHMLINVVVKGVNQLLIYDFVDKKETFLKTVDPLPSNANSYYLKYNADTKIAYPKSAVLGVTFGYGFTILIIIIVAVYVMNRGDFSSMREDAKRWELGRLQKFSNIGFFVLGFIQMIVVFSLAQEINSPGLATVATFMELHKALFGIFTAVWYKAKTIPIYYLLSALAIIFNFVSFITSVIHNPKIFYFEVGGERFYSAVAFFTFFFSVVYLVYFFIKIRKSSSMSNFDYKSGSNVNDIAYDSILNNENYDDED